MNFRYKVRREMNGAIIFDTHEKGALSFLEKETYNALISPFDLKSLHSEFFIQNKFYIFKNGKWEANFIHIDVCNSNQTEWLSAPKRIYLELTRRCNLRCKMCYNASTDSLPNELTTLQFKEILDQMAQIAIFEARLTGGEPTQRPDFLEILDYAIFKGFYVSLASNGVWSDELTHEICSRRIDDVIISLEGSPEINNRFRANGCFDRTIKSMKALKQAGVNKVRINTVISRYNWRDIEILFRICREFDLLLIDFIHPRPYGRGGAQKAKNQMLTAKETLEFNYLVKDLRKKYKGVKVVMDFDLFSEDELSLHPIVPRIKACPAGREFFFLNPQGYVFPCGVAPVHDFSLMTEQEKKLFIAGNVLEQKIIEIWHQSSIWEDYRDLHKCKPPKCFSCKYWGKKCFGTCPVGAYYHT